MRYSLGKRFENTNWREEARRRLAQNLGLRVEEKTDEYSSWQQRYDVFSPTDMQLFTVSVTRNDDGTVYVGGLGNMLQDLQLGQSAAGWQRLIADTDDR